MIQVDFDNTKYLCVILDSSDEIPDGHRTTVSVPHEQGIELHRQLTEYYGKIEGVRMQERKGFFGRLFGK